MCFTISICTVHTGVPNLILLPCDLVKSFVLYFRVLFHNKQFVIRFFAIDVFNFIAENQGGVNLRRLAPAQRRNVAVLRWRHCVQFDLPDSGPIAM